MSNTDRRTFLQSAGLAGIASTMSSAAVAQGTPAAEKAKTEAPASKHSIRFSVIGLDHAHIYSDDRRGSTWRRPTRGRLRLGPETDR